MAKLKLLTKTGKQSSKEYDLDDELFGQEPNKHLLYLAKIRQESNARAGSAHTKTRPEVRGGGAKPWKQKGTGRARAGSRNSPLWRGGGVIFGPRNQVNWVKGMNRKESAISILSALTLVYNEQRLSAIEDIDVSKTSQVADLVKGSENCGKRVLFVVESNNPQYCTLVKAARNLIEAKLIDVATLNVNDILKADTVILTTKALDQVKERFATKAVAA